MYRAIDLFAGIGGIRLGFDEAFKDDVQTVFVSEWDKFAQLTYTENFNDNFEIAGDITKINEREIPEFDICLAGFPCQAFSLAGHRKGFNDDYKGMSRGTLFFEVTRICDYHKPKVIFCENVKGLTIHDKGRTFEIIVKTLDEMGYNVYSDILNSKDFGVPQNRERVYIVAFRKDINSSGFEFPKPSNTKVMIKDILESENVSVKYYLSTQYLDTLRAHKKRHEEKGHGFGYEIRSLDSIAGAIVCGGMGRERNLIVDNKLNDFTPITHIKGTVNRESVRKMTPREWARLQGFPDTYKIPLADTHMYKQFGNSVTVNVIEAVAKNIKKVLEEQKTSRNLEVKKEWSNQMTSGNIGEWSEIYTFMKLIKDGKIYAANENVQKINNLYFPIIKIIREENKGEVFDYQTGEKIKIYHNGSFVKEVLSDNFEEQAEFLFNLMKGEKKGNIIFNDADNFIRFLHDIFITKVKATSSNKSDIVMEIIDINTGYSPTAGFSIKSEIGSAPTLMNASGATNFVFRITGIDDNDMVTINRIDGFEKIIKRFNRLYERAHRVEFFGMKNAIFRDNLELIDSKMPDIVANAMVYRYRDNIKNYLNIVDLLVQNNPLNYNNPEVYRYKFKKLLCASALGMLPATRWNGIDEANGGYIIVKANGEVLAYYIYNRNAFEDYLLNSTYLESGSTTKHDFATIYKVNGEYYINMNMQIRFI